MTKREMTIEEAIEIFKEVRAEVLAKETELSKQVFENLGIKAIDVAIKALEQQPNRCDGCTHSEEQDGSNCYECIKGMADNFEAQPTDADCISREAVKEMLSEEWTKYMPMDLDINLSFVMGKISELPSVTPKGVTITDFADRCRECGKQKVGKWKILDECANEGVYCSKCHKKIFKLEFSHTMKWRNFKYCPNCGADMRGDSE